VLNPGTAPAVPDNKRLDKPIRMLIIFMSACTHPNQAEISGFIFNSL